MRKEEESMTDADEQGSFKVEDRRQFTAQGDPIKSFEETGEAAEERTRTAQPEEQKGKESPPEKEDWKQVEIDFAGFLLSLATSAMAYLGEVPDPGTGTTDENLPAAKQMIDILSVLQAKTKGNLEPDEYRLLDNLLYELRMKYLDKTQKVKL